MVVDNRVDNDVYDDVESCDVDGDSAVVVVDELFKGYVNGDNNDDDDDDDDDVVAVNVVDVVKRLVLQDVDTNIAGDDHHKGAWSSALMHTRARVDEDVIVEDAMKEEREVRNVSEDVNVDVDVIVDEVVVEDVDNDQVEV